MYLQTAMGQCVYTVKRGFKWISLTQECVMVGSESNIQSFETPANLVEIFSKSLHFEGGRGQRQFGKSLLF